MDERQEDALSRFVEAIPAETERAATAVVDTALKVHKTLGPGLLESVYQVGLCHELRQRGVTVDSEVSLPVVYEGITLDAALRIDLIVEKRVLVELKAVERVEAVHAAQVISYLKLTRLRLGLLINFHVPLLKQGLKRFAN